MYVRTVSCVPAPKHEHARRRQTNRTVRSDEGQLIRLERPLTSDLISRSVVHQYININTSIHINTLRQKSGEAIYLWRLGPTKRATVKRRPGRLPLADDATWEERRRFHREAAAAVATATATATTLRLCLENKLYCLLFANLEIRGVVILAVGAKLRRYDVARLRRTRLLVYRRLVAWVPDWCRNPQYIISTWIWKEGDAPVNGSGIEPGHYAKKILVPRSISISSLASALTFYFRMTYERSYLRTPCHHATIPTKRKEPERRPSSNSRSRSRSRFAFLILAYSLVRLIGGGAAAQHGSLGLHSIRFMDGVMHCTYICIAVVT